MGLTVAKLCKDMKLFFLNLTTFSKHGGIERFNRCFLKALKDIQQDTQLESIAYSMHDTNIIEAYYDKERYRGFNGNKISFVIQSVLKAFSSDIVILGHVNLAIVGLIIKRIYPKKRVLLITHGVDVWSELDGVKRKFLKVVDEIVCVSQFTKNKLVDVNKVAAEKVRIFPNTIDPYFPIPESFNIDTDLRSRYNLDKEDYVVFTLTRINEKEGFKGYDNVITALADIIDKVPRAKYVLAGKYTDVEKQRIDDVVKRYNLSDNVIFTGFIKEEELVSHYLMADIFVMPSKKEGFGIVFLEALVCGLPVIGGNADGSYNTLLEGDLGTLVNPDSTEEIGAAILKNAGKDKELLSEKYQRQELTLKHYSFEEYKNRLKNIIGLH